ncbi:MAG: TIGR04084 family radical SAM/SPASM domain-containing protein [Acidilobus sp.]|jgi:putative peptide-modifying radical SAM enzyme|uniref:TIGR04084 family radical SAM/SPASM domain-containing protein n=1 Tax=Acidilobus sp. 7A TaxID=1577685 RepID=UPI000764DE0A|nr:TIGR04084 family radical SAM/SPASM domain-containing protein [Acidilobus sp. 7A]AMD30655.1 radical SAM protein [Acidilobus sp. 7A]
MLWLVFTTGACNLRCDYCGGSFPEKVVPYTVKYDPLKLKKVVEADRDATVIFYGGEPLINPRFVEWVMDNVRARRYGVQTNGTLHRLLPDAYWKRMNVALLSIDGREEVTDKHRGRGVYRKVTEAARHVRSLGVETIARMAVTADTDIYEDVTHLLSLGLFDKVHWQLDVVWSPRWDFEGWAERSYLPGIRRLVDLFLRELERGRVLRMIPILGVISAHYFGGYPGSPCGAGYRSFAISTDGRVLACPIAVYERWAELGTVEGGFRPMGAYLAKECAACPYRRYCGGRCLYSMIERDWGEEGFKAVDRVTRAYLDAVLSAIPRVDELVREGVVRLEDLRYDPTQDSTEVIP